MKLLLRVGDAAEACSISKSRAYELINAGVLPALRLGPKGSWRVSVVALEAWINERAAAAQDGNGPEEGTTNVPPSRV